jgi:3-oxoacyl-[acyl-carrier protein] reductase
MKVSQPLASSCMTGDDILSTAKAAAVVKEITDKGGEAFAICGDVTADDFPKRLIGGTIE